jgi:hypothetical protein
MASKTTGTCKVEFENSGSLLMKRISVSLRDNAIGIALFLLLAIVVGLILASVGNDMWKTYAQWRTQSDASRAIRGTSDANKSGGALFEAHPDDDVEEPEPTTPDGVALDLPGEPQVALLKRRMGKIKAKYDAYNRAMVKHVGETGAEPDVIDERILAHNGNDEYDYKKGRSTTLVGPDGTGRDPRQ